MSITFEGEVDKVGSRGFSGELSFNFKKSFLQPSWIISISKCETR